MLELGESGLPVADGLSNLLKVSNQLGLWPNVIVIYEGKDEPKREQVLLFYVNAKPFTYVISLVRCMQCRLPATIRCLSHPSAHVRALSTSVLRDILQTGLIKTNSKPVEINGPRGPSYQYFNLDDIDWQADIEKCLRWEAHSQLATGRPIQFLDAAAKELGCTISI